MAFKIICAIACIAAASAIELQYNPEYSGYNTGYNTGARLLVAPQVDKYYDAPAQYDFAYGVKDPKTGDIKEQQESRRGDVVKGRYSLVDSDGYERIVEYSADDKNGFNAVVQRQPTKYQVPVPVVQKVIAGPVLSKIAIQSPTLYYGGADQGYLNNGYGLQKGVASSYSSQISNSGSQYDYKY